MELQVVKDDIKEMRRDIEDLKVRQLAWKSMADEVLKNCKENQ